MSACKFVESLLRFSLADRHVLSIMSEHLEWSSDWKLCLLIVDAHGV